MSCIFCGKLNDGTICRGCSIKQAQHREISSLLQQQIIVDEKHQHLEKVKTIYFEKTISDLKDEIVNLKNELENQKNLNLKITNEIAISEEEAFNKGFDANFNLVMFDEDRVLKSFHDNPYNLEKLKRAYDAGVSKKIINEFGSDSISVNDFESLIFQAGFSFLDSFSSKTGHEDVDYVIRYSNLNNTFSALLWRKFHLVYDYICIKDLNNKFKIGSSFPKLFNNDNLNKIWINGFQKYIDTKINC